MFCKYVQRINKPKMAQKSNSRKNKQCNKDNCENKEHDKSNNKCPEKYMKHRRKEKPIACVQPQKNLHSTPVPNTLASVKATVSGTISTISDSNQVQNVTKNSNNSQMYLGQPLVDFSTVANEAHVKNVNFPTLPNPYHPFTCPVMNWNYLAALRLPPSPDPVISYPPPIVGLTVYNIPSVTPALTYPQILSVTPIHNFANIVLPGTSVLPYSTFNLFEYGFRYSGSQLSPMDCNSSTYSFALSQSQISSEVSNSFGKFEQHSATESVIASPRFTSESIQEVSIKRSDPLELYLSLPEDLFPKIRMLSLDPNPIIDVFCKVTDIDKYEPWVLDLEYGVPRKPVTRPIAIYDVQCNSIHCKNTPGAIHPGFENCNSDFKSVVMFYYDCIISAWYRGYTIMYVDVSVANYQSWLRPPMQVFGMCWR